MISQYLERLNLKERLILIMLILSIFLIGLLIVLYHQSERLLYKNLEKQIMDLTKAIQIGVEEVTGSSDEKRLSQYLNELKSKGIKEISIISNTDEVLASTNPEKIGKEISPKKKDMIIRAELGEPLIPEGRTYNVIIPVITNNEHYGYLHLQINTEDFTRLLRENMTKRLVVTLTVFGLSIILIVILSSQYIKPLRDIIDAVKKIAGGDYETKINISRKDELGELIINLNKLSTILREEQQLRELLRKTEHLAMIGQFARQVAHEVRNPLNFMNLSIDYLDKKIDSNRLDHNELRMYLQMIKNEIHRLDKLTLNFLEYSKPFTVNLKPVNPSILIRDTVEFIRPKAESAGISINTVFMSSPEIEGDPELLKTCLINVILNAIQAMSDGGNIDINTRSEDSSLIISISDTGHGIERKDMDKVFEPLFTTKPHGLGLGLSITKKIIEEHRGKINIQSRTDGDSGTTVTIILPIRKPEEVFYGSPHS